MTTDELERELKAWKQAVHDARTTREWLEARADRKSTRIRELEAQVKQLKRKTNDHPA